MEIGINVINLGDKIVGGWADGFHKVLKIFAIGRKYNNKEHGEKLAVFVNELQGKKTAAIEMINSNHEDLSAFVKNLAKNVDTMMLTITNMHKEKADNLEENLEKEAIARLEDFNVMIANIQKGNNDIEKFATGKFNGFITGHPNMSKALKNDLTKYITGIVRESRKLCDSFSDDREKMAAKWVALTAVMAGENGAQPVLAAIDGVPSFGPEKIKMEICQFCMKEITAGSVLCKDCGSKIGAKQISEKQRPAQAAGATKIRMPSIGSRLHSNYVQAPYYQNQLVTEESLTMSCSEALPTTNQDQLKKRRNKNGNWRWS